MPKPLDRFEAKYVEDPNTGCWVWTAYRNRDGYGVFGLGKRNVLAHRFSYQEYVEPIPSGMNVLHGCDNPPCVNPDHLFLGTQADNVADAMLKGRWGHDAPREDKMIKGRLTIEQRAEMRRLHREEGIGQRRLGQMFGVSHQTARYWIKRKDFDQLAES